MQNSTGLVKVGWVPLASIRRTDFLTCPVAAKKVFDAVVSGYGEPNVRARFPSQDLLFFLVPAAASCTSLLREPRVVQDHIASRGQVAIKPNQVVEALIRIAVDRYARVRRSPNHAHAAPSREYSVGFRDSHTYVFVVRARSPPQDTGSMASAFTHLMEHHIIPYAHKTDPRGWRRTLRHPTVCIVIDKYAMWAAAQCVSVRACPCVP